MERDSEGAAVTGVWLKRAHLRIHLSGSGENERCPKKGKLCYHLEVWEWGCQSLSLTPRPGPGESRCLLTRSPPCHFLQVAIYRLITSAHIEHVAWAPDP